MIPVDTGVPGSLKMYPVLLTLCTTAKPAVDKGVQDSIPICSQTPCVQPPKFGGVPNNPRYSVPSRKLQVLSPCTPVLTQSFHRVIRSTGTRARRR